MNLALKLCSADGVAPDGCHVMGACHPLTVMRKSQVTFAIPLPEVPGQWGGAVGMEIAVTATGVLEMLKRGEKECSQT